jgi:adenine nucleotide transporter 17
MAKVRIQTRTKSKDGSQVLPSHRGKSHASEGALDILQRVYREEGPVGWYRGMGAQIAKAVLSQGVLFMSKDQFERWALVLMATLYRMQQSRA